MKYSISTDNSTDSISTAEQHLQYLPYGESFVNQRTSEYSDSFTFTGKERDEETGYTYHGARYFDAALLTGWMAVDPMSDKYPSLSPYNYCAWNPVKLVDPNGKEIFLGTLSEEMQQRLCSCLGYITGLNLYVNEDGLLMSSGYRKDKKKISKTAQKDLLEAINDKETRVTVATGQKSKAETEGEYNSIFTHKLFLSELLSKDNDNETNGLGMTFFHELAHAYFGDKDPSNEYSENYKYNDACDYRPEPIRNYVGSAVARVNIYRKEMKMPIRVTYDPYRYQETDPASWKQFDGKVAFMNHNSIEYRKLF